MVREAQWDMFKRCEIDRAGLCALADHARAAGIVLFSTPTSEEGIADIQAARMPLLKNGSDYLTNTPLIEAMARSGLPTVLSTGMATLGEIDDAVRAFTAAGGKELVLLGVHLALPDASCRRAPSPPAVSARRLRPAGGFQRSHRWAGRGVRLGGARRLLRGEALHPRP